MSYELVLRELQDAQAAGYTVFLVFIGIDNPELVVARVIQRVEDGGHDVPDVKIRSRFPRTLVNLQQAVPFVDFAYLFDNSSYDEPYRLVAAFSWERRRPRRHQSGQRPVLLKSRRGRRRSQERATIPHSFNCTCSGIRRSKWFLRKSWYRLVLSLPEGCRRGCQRSQSFESVGTGPL
jgi:hypothetical protein